MGKMTFTSSLKEFLRLLLQKLLITYKHHKNYTTHKGKKLKYLYLNPKLE